MAMMDTYIAVEGLEEAGASRGLAKAIVDAIREGRQGLVTKADLYLALLVQVGVLAGVVAAVISLVPPASS